MPGFYKNNQLLSDPKQKVKPLTRELKKVVCFYFPLKKFIRPLSFDSSVSDWAVFLNIWNIVLVKEHHLVVEYCFLQSICTPLYSKYVFLFPHKVFPYHDKEFMNLSQFFFNCDPKRRENFTIFYLRHNSQSFLIVVL